jgi:hypothetical protein
VSHKNELILFSLVRLPPTNPFCSFLLLPFKCAVFLYPSNQSASPERGRLGEGRRATMGMGQRENVGGTTTTTTPAAAATMDEDEELRIWRNSMEPMQAFARRMSCVSSLGCWRSGSFANHHLMRSITPTPVDPIIPSSSAGIGTGSGGGGGGDSSAFPTKGNSWSKSKTSIN